MKQLKIFLSFALFLLIPLTWERENQALANQHFSITQTANPESEKVMNLVWRLPEIQQKASEISRLSNGQVRVKIMLENTPTKTEPYYTVRVFEDNPDRIVTLYWFRVNMPGERITVQDEITGEYISLEQWRKK
ncbi:hypothetical protein NIES2119_02680 [[Phormidium ambiguum] IAM M-71]|uniref:Uncharacterized protein n=1 Tax=[Phormidium ambiguum] IAM M-71 TaxID=454136 RepID=A0A1U7ISR2_9CYAN|nr:hypothetical protein [Phormidium ambiguum]OKH40534.1 hypothetical protein NIES2119_02680 [Phormidium ambiguum IAM M-71]